VNKNFITLNLVFIMGVVFFTTPMLAQNNGTKNPHRVPRVDTPVTVDAVLDEAAWDKALIMELNSEVRPGENIPPPVKTEVLFAYSDSYLYAAVRAYDPNPSEIRARVCDRDKMYGDDWVALIIDTFNDERRTFDFFSNPLGIQGDQIESPTGGGGDWDAIWDSNGRITPEGYVVEMAIPFSSMRFQRSPGDQIWGIDVVRSYPRSVRHHIGMFPRDRNNNCYMCQSEKLVGFAGATPGKNIEFDPTFYSVLTQEREDFTEGSFVERDKDFEPGLTARWGFTPNLTLNTTINPDFSNVEADVAQLDINTQFALYYPERRPFFLEGGSFFNTRLNAIHSRTLADPIWGTKLTGKEGANAVGLFIVRDKLTNFLFPGSQGSSTTSQQRESTGSVLRYRRDFGRSSNIGLLLTDRESNEYYNRLGGFDGILKFTLKDQIRFQVLGSQTSYPDTISTEFNQPAGRFDGLAYDIFYMHDTRSLDWYAVYREVGRDFRADIGFMPQSNFRAIDVGWGHTWNNNPDHWWNMLNFGSGYEREEDLDGKMLEKSFTFWFNYAGLAQSFFDLNGGYGKQSYNGIEFDNRYLQFDFGLRPSGSLFLMIEGLFGDRIDYANTRPGERIRFEPYVEYKMGRHLVTSISHTFERLTVDPGRLYTANISQLRMVYQFNKRTFLRTILQYVNYDRNADLYIDEVNSESKSLFSQVLFSYKINPQTVLFLGYSDNHFGDREIKMTQTNRTFFVKIGYAWVL
jgi:hypothetical protein